MNCRVAALWAKRSQILRDVGPFRADFRPIAGSRHDDIEAGGWRLLDLSAPPFDLACSVLTEYRVVQKPGVWIKQMVLVSS